jgi:hypothetical protein
MAKGRGRTPVDAIPLKTPLLGASRSRAYANGHAPTSRTQKVGAEFRAVRASTRCSPWKQVISDESCSQLIVLFLVRAGHGFANAKHKPNTADGRRCQGVLCAGKCFFIRVIHRRSGREVAVTESLPKATQARSVTSPSAQARRVLSLVEPRSGRP